MSLLSSDSLSINAGHYSKEYCNARIAESVAKDAILKDEYNTNLKIIADKVKGKTRAAQHRNWEIREILTIRAYGRQRWYNGGVA